MFQSTPQELLTISSIGQQETGSVGIGASQAGESILPIYEYGRCRALGASQEPSPDTAHPVDSPDLLLPNSAVLSPSFTAAIGKASPALQPHQVFEGTITDVSQGTFLATLCDKTDPSNPDEIMEFEDAEVSSEDRRLLTPGSAFYWIIGRERTIGGQIKNVSILQFRRVPAWTEGAIARAAERARQVTELLRKGDDAVDTTESR